MGILVKPRRLFVVALLSGLAGCASLLTAFTPGPVAITRGVAFDPDTGLELDVYAPPQAKDAPVVVIVPDYRLYPAVRFPAFLDDCARAVVWAHRHAAQFGGDGERLVLMGHSAGAYNAAMLALDAGLLQRAGGSRQWLRGMVGFGGPYDFLPITDPMLRQVFGPTEQWPDTQPVNRVAAGSPPMLLVHGSADTTVRPRNSQSLAARVTASGGSATELLLPGLDHMWPLLALAGPLRWRAPVLDRIDDFLQRVTARTGMRGGASRVDSGSWRVCGSGARAAKSGLPWAV